MQQRHPERPQEVRVALDGRSAGVPDQPMSGGEVTRVGHRDHRVVEEGEIGLAVNVESRAGNERQAQRQLSGDGQRENGIDAPARSAHAYQTNLKILAVFLAELGFSGSSTL